MFIILFLDSRSHHLASDVFLLIYFHFHVWCFNFDMLVRLFFYILFFGHCHQYVWCCITQLHSFVSLLLHYFSTLLHSAQHNTTQTVRSVGNDWLIESDLLPPSADIDNVGIHLILLVNRVSSVSYDIYSTIRIYFILRILFNICKYIMICYKVNYVDVVHKGL